MRNSNLILLLSFASFGFCDLMLNLFDRDQLDTSCTAKDNSKDGIYRLIQDCLRLSSERQGYIPSERVVVVCCFEPKRPKPPMNINSKRVIKRKSEAESYCESTVVSTIDATNHIIEGTRSGVGEFPHMAALGYGFEGDEFDCGGSIISDRFVITAAHCADRRNGQPTVVRVGRTSLNLYDERDSSSYTDAKVKQVYIHGNYKPPKSYHDIALIELEDSLTFSDNVHPLCLQVDSFSDEMERNFTIIGFGRTDRENRTARSDWLLKATVQEMAYAECHQNFQNFKLAKIPDGIINSQICARDKNPNAADACQGDSGSSMQICDKDFKYVLVGITSFGMGCGSNFPSVYTRVSDYIPWIENIVWPEIP